MSLLREIQSAAIEGDSDIETLLRKCRLLAARLDHAEFRNWVVWELDGYPHGVELPDYRQFHCQCFGHFSGPFGSGIRNAPIPESCIPKEIRESLTYVRLREGVAFLKNLVAVAESDLLQWNWPADAGRLFGGEIYQNVVLAQGWTSFSRSSVVGILSTVRNRILNFALEIEASNPDAGEAAPGSSPVPHAKVAQIFHTNIYGNVGSFASGSEIQQTVTINIKQGNFDSLAAYLRSQGVGETDVKILRAAVNSDVMVSNANFGEKVNSWIQNMVKKAAAGTWKIATSAATDLLTSALKAYYGLGT